jgi:predicted nuclease of restriction endonuclease-like (RecB) superfamily
MYMRAFAEAYPDEQIVQQVAGQIPWFHNCTLLDKVKDKEERIWYSRKTVEHGWSRAVLVHQIELDLYNRQGKATHNFNKTLPAPQSELARQVLKDPYVFDFLSVGQEAEERDIEAALIEHIRKFLLELGVGFAFVGNQYHVEVGDEDFYIDLLFYHLKLRRYIVIELKAGKFKPEYLGKMGFYMVAVDRQLKHVDDLPTIGILLCKEHNKTVAEYALQVAEKPMGVASYRLSSKLPAALKKCLPAPELLAEEMDKQRG